MLLGSSGSFKRRGLIGRYWAIGAVPFKGLLDPGPFLFLCFLTSMRQQKHSCQEVWPLTTGPKHCSHMTTDEHLKPGHKMTSSFIGCLPQASCQNRMLPHVFRLEMPMLIQQHDISLPPVYIPMHSPLSPVF